MERAKRIQCPAPLPKEPIIPLLTKMLVSAPENKPRGKTKGVRSGPCCKIDSDMMSEDKTRSSTAKDDDEEEEEETNSPPDGRKKKRASSTNVEAEAPKKGKGPLAGSSAWYVDSSLEQRPRNKPLAAS